MRSVLLSDMPFEHQFSYPMPEVLSDLAYRPASIRSNLVEREHADSPRLQRRHSGLHSRVYDDPKMVRSISNTPLPSPVITLPSKLKRTNTAMDKPSKFPFANVTRNKRHKAKQSIKDDTLSLPSSPITSEWSESIRGTPLPQPPPAPSPIDNSVIDISSGESNTSELDYASDNTIRQPSPPPPNQLQIAPVQIDTPLKNFTTPNPETYSTPNADMDISSLQITSIHRDYLYPEEYNVGNGPRDLARKIFNGRGKNEVLFTKDCIEEVALDSKKIQQLSSFKDSIQAIDAGDEDGLAMNAPHNYQRAQTVPLPDKLEEHESARLSIEYIAIPAGRSHEEIQKIVIDTAMAVNTMLFNEQKILRRLEHSISQNIVQSAVQGLISQDAQSIHKGISKMFDNFSIMTRAVNGTEESVRLNSDYATNTHKHQQDLLKKFETLYNSIDLNSQQHFAEIEKALLHQNKLIMELSSGKEQPQTKTGIQPIPSFSSLHPQTVVSHTCNANTSPEILEGFKSLNNTIGSLVAQVASMRSSMDKMEKQLAGKSTPTISTTQNQSPIQHIPQRTITPRPQTPRPSTPIPTQPQGPPPPPQINHNTKPKGAPGRPELYEDQAPNAFIADLSQGANWFLERAIKAPDDQIHSWARALGAPNWGYLSQNGFLLLCKPTLEVRCKRNFIILSIMRAFNAFQGCHKFLVPPDHPIPTTDVDEMCNYYTFTFSSGLRPPPTRRGRITPSYYPGWTPEEVKAKLDHNTKMRNPKYNPQLQNQPKTVSFADVTAGKKTNEVPKVRSTKAEHTDRLGRRQRTHRF